MNTAVGPTIAFSPTIASTLSFSSGNWSGGGTIYTATYAVSDASVSVNGVAVTVSGAANADGNTQTADTQNNVFAINTVNPTVTAITPSVATINDAIATGGTFTLAVSYSAAMNTVVNPTIAFSPAIASTLSLSSGAWSDGGTIYTATYAVSNASVSVSGVAVTVNGAQNADGNTQTADTQNNVFAIDTVNPTVSAITPSVSSINDSTATSGTFALAVTYSAAMNTAVNPTIAFSPTIASTLSFSSGAWTGGGTIYTATFAVSNADVIVNGVDVTVSGAQNADGNPQTSDTQNNVFAIDTVNPTVSSIAPSVSTINDATAASGTFTLAVTYSAVMNTSDNPTIAFSPTIASTLSFSSGAWSGGGTVYAATYAVSNASVSVSGVDVTVSGAQNADGNSQTSDTQDTVFAIDTVNPTVSAIAPSVATINDATAAAGTFTLAVTYSAAMNTAVNPTIAFSPAIASTLSFSSGAWSGGGTVYTATYAVSNAGVSVGGVGVTVSGAQNTDGNAQSSHTQNNVFAIDTVNPTVTAITPSVATINDATATSGSFTLAVTYSAAMNTAINPTIAFSPTIASTLSFSLGAWSGGGTIYTATYAVSNANVSISAVDVTVTGAHNTDGNTQTSDTQNNVFAIDTVNPSVTAIAPSVTTINDATAASGPFTLAVTYSTAMNTAVNPTIAFSPTIGSTLSFSAGAWSGGGTVYTATYAVSNAAVSVAGVNVTVSGAQDAYGNPQTADTQNNVFAIDTVNPTVTAITPSVATINDATAAGGTFTLAVTYSSAMNTSVNPIIAFSPTIAATLSFASGTWSGGGTIYIATYSVSNAGVSVSGVDVTVSGAQNVDGNTQTADTQNNVFAIDTVNPTVTAIAPSVTTINVATVTGGTFTLAVTYSEAMNTAINPTIAFSPTIASTLSLSSGAWSGDGTIYTATYAVSNANVSITGVAVTVSGAQNTDGNPQTADTQNNVFAIDTVPPTVSAQPSSQTFFAGTVVTLTAVAGGLPAPTVQWQVSVDGGHTFSNIPGATSPTYSFTSSAAQGGDEYWAVFTNASGTTFSSVATLTINPALAVLAAPQSTVVALGQKVTFTATGTGTHKPTVQWQVSADDGSTWSNIPGATSTSLSFTATQAQNGNQYRALFASSAGQAASPAATLTVNFTVQAARQPQTMLVAAGTPVTLTAAAAGDPAPMVQWMVSTNKGKTFSPISGATSTSYSFTPQSGDSGKLFEAVFSNLIGKPIATAPITLTVGAVPTITTSPTAVTANAGGTATFTAVATGSPAPAVQWQVSTDGGVTFNNVGGATSASLTLHNLTAAQDGSMYRAVFLNAVGQTTTAAVKLSVHFAPTVTRQPVSQTVVAGTQVTFTAASNADPTASVQWMVSTNKGKTYSAIAGATSLSYSFTALSIESGETFEAVFTNGIGKAATTLAATLTADVLPGVQANPSSQTAVNGVATFSVVPTGTSPTVQWQVSTNGGMTWSKVSGGTKATLVLRGLAAAQDQSQYRAVVTNAVGTFTTATATLTVPYGPVIL